MAVSSAIATYMTLYNFNNFHARPADHAPSSMQSLELGHVIPLEANLTSFIAVENAAPRKRQVLQLAITSSHALRDSQKVNKRRGETSEETT